MTVFCIFGGCKMKKTC